MRKQKLLCIAFFSFLFFSCEYQDVEEVKFRQKEQGWVFPLLSTQLELEDMIDADEEEQIEFVEDGSGHKIVQVVYREDNIASVSANDIYTIPDFSYSETYAVGERKITGGSLPEIKVSLSNIISNSGSTALNSFINRDMEITQGFSIGNAGDYSYSAGLENIKWAIIHEGSIKLKITNKMKVPIRVSFSLVNDNASRDVVGTVSLPEDGTFIPVGGYAEVNLSDELAGKRIESNLIAEFAEFATAPSDGVIRMQTSDYFSLETTVGDLVLESGEVRLPQQLIETQEYNATFGEDDMKLKELKTKNAMLSLQIASDIPVGSEISVRFPETRNASGEAVVVNYTINFARQNPKVITIDLSNTVCMLDAQGGYNSFPVEVTATLLPTGTEYIVFDRMDKVSVKSISSDIEVDYIKGYLGQHNFSIAEDYFELDNELFDLMEGSVKLSEPKFSFYVENQGVGIPVQMDFSLTRDDSQTLTRTIDFEAAPTIGVLHEQEIVVANLPGQKDLTNLLSIPLKKISYRANATVNPEASGSTEQFFEGDAMVSIGALVELPLDVQIDNLILREELEVTKEDDSDDFSNYTDHIEDAALKLNVKNGFPFKLVLGFVFKQVVGETELPLFTLPADLTLPITDETYVVEAAQTQSGVAVEGQEGEGRFTMPLTKEMIEMLDDVDVIEIIAYLYNGNEQTAKIYTDYKIDVNIGVVGNISTDFDFDNEDE